MKAWAAQQPAMHFGSFVRGVVVNDEVKLTVAVIGELGVYAFQKGQEFLVAMALVASAQDPSRGRVVSSKQRKGPVTHIIVGLTLGQTRTQRQALTRSRRWRLSVIRSGVWERSTRSAPATVR